MSEKQIEVSYTSAPLTKKKTSALVSTLEGLYQKRKVILASDLVKEVAAKNHPLHGEFEWNNTKAAEKYRLHQARQLIASVRIRIMDDGVQVEPTRAYVNVRPEENDSLGLPARGYAPTLLAMGSTNHKMQVLQYAHSQLMGWKKRFGNLKEFAQVVSAIEQTKV
jgi:hypothetical protein